MPTPLEILMDPISLGVLFVFFSLMLVEHLFPGRELPRVPGWTLRAGISFIVYFYLATYLPLLWDAYLAEYQVFNLESMSIAASTLIAVLVFELLIYLWHRAMHEKKWLWRTFHQMHHSAERVDTLGAFYFSPLDMIGFTFLGSLSLVVVIGVTPQVATYFLFITTFLVVFQHTNIRTPVWLGYLIQRPESHSVHHAKGIHRYNYSDLPVFDMLFGTFRNPDTFEQEAGFYHGASKRIPEMLVFQDVSKHETTVKPVKEVNAG